MKAHDYFLIGSAILLAWLGVLIIQRNVEYGSDDLLTMNLINMFNTVTYFVLFLGVALILMGAVKHFVARKSKNG